jgi:NDP-sugar pyrophosphorylase family protein
MTTPTILILAAGFATRYGSLKQIDRFGPGGETIIDYTIYDAIRAGFGKAVFVIRDSIADAFRRIVTDKFADKIAVTLVSQEIDMLPAGFKVPPARQKPWGTGHAVWVAARQISEPFVALNADDFYGFSTLETIYRHLCAQSHDGLEYCSIGYKLENTLTEHGHVSRAICDVDQDGFLTGLTEVSRIARVNGRIKILDSSTVLPGDTPVSMNAFGFTPTVFDYFQAHFAEFLTSHLNEPGAEFYLPAFVNSLIRHNLVSVRILPTDAEWFGVTYREDKEPASKKIRELVANGRYPERLWR